MSSDSAAEFYKQAVLALVDVEQNTHQMQVSVAISAALAVPLLATIGIAYLERWAGSAVMLNLFKCSLAGTLFTIVLLSRPAAREPMTPESIYMLMLSAFLGIVVGDVAWLQAIKLIGARTCILLGALKPFVAKLVGIIFLGQPASLLLVLGISLTSFGLVLAHLGRHDAPVALSDSTPDPQPVEKTGETPPLEIAINAGSSRAAAGRAGSFSSFGASSIQKSNKLVFGVALQLFNMVIDVVAAALTRAYGGGASSWQMNTIRFGSAAIFMLLLTAGARLVAIVRSVRPPSWASFPVMSAHAWFSIIVGVILFTFLTPAFGNFALFRLHFGAWSALTALGPVFSIPVFWILKGERTRMMGVVGAILAATGAAVISAAAARSKD